MKKRYFIFTFYYEPDLCAGTFRSSGLVRQLYKNFNEAEIYVFASQPNRYDSYSPKQPLYENLNSRIHIYRSPIIRRVPFKSPLNFLIYFVFSIYKSIRIKNPDVVFATSSRLFTAILGYVVSRITKCEKLIIDIRDIFSDTLASLKKNSNYILQISKIIKKIEKLILEKADVVIFVSEGFVQYFKELDLQNYYVLTNGIDENFLNESYEKEIVSKSKKIVYLGNIGEGQGLQYILPNIAEEISSDYSIEVYGGGKYQHELKNICMDMGLQNKIKINGPVTRREVIQIYKDADYLFLHLNNYKAFEKVLPSKIFEYANTNKPILAGVNGYAREFIQDNVDGCLLFEPCNSKDFIQKFNQKKLKPFYDRSEFVKQYTREEISKKIANIFNVGDKK